MAIERLRPLGLGRRQHRVEQRHAIAAVAHAGGGIQRAERRVRLPRFPELRIEAEKVRLAEQDVDRRRPRRIVAGRPMVRQRRVQTVADCGNGCDGDIGAGSRLGTAPAREPADPRSRDRSRGSPARRAATRTCRRARGRAPTAPRGDRGSPASATSARPERVGLDRDRPRRSRRRRFRDSAAVRPVITGTPHAIASTTGRPKPFVHRRVDEHLGEAVERRQVLERHVAGELDRVRRPGAR